MPTTFLVCFLICMPCMVLGAGGMSLYRNPQPDEGLIGQLPSTTAAHPAIHTKKLNLGLCIVFPAINTTKLSLCLSIVFPAIHTTKLSLGLSIVHPAIHTTKLSLG